MVNLDCLREVRLDHWISMQIEHYSHHYPDFEVTPFSKQLIFKIKDCYEDIYKKINVSMFLYVVVKHDFARIIQTVINQLPLKCQ